MVRPPLELWYAHTDIGTRLRLRYELYGDWVEYVIDEQGATVRVAHSARVLLQEVGELLFGPVMNCVLAQRGFTCLHTAVVRVQSRAVALLGFSGAGKSTTALALVQRGGTLVSDDSAVLTELDGRVAVLPGAARIRVRPDAGEALVRSFEQLDTVWGDGRPGLGKRYVPVPRPATLRDEEACALDAVYFLNRRDDGVAQPALRRLAPALALPKLMAHRPMSWALDRECDKRDFKVLARLAQTVPAFDLLRPDDLETTGQTVAAIASDVCSQA